MQSEHGNGKLHVTGEQRVVAPRERGVVRPGSRGVRAPDHVQGQDDGQQRVQAPTTRERREIGAGRFVAEQPARDGRVCVVHAQMLPAVRHRATVNRGRSDKQQRHVHVPDHLSLQRQFDKNRPFITFVVEALMA